MNITMDVKYKGMTVNERLYVSGLSDAFSKAVAEKNVDDVIAILEKVELTEPSIIPILEQLGLHSRETDS
jgi:hypothetical protein